MKKVVVSTASKQYSVYIQAGLRKEVGGFLQKLLKKAPSSVLVVTDSQVAKRYLTDVTNSFDSQVEVFQAVIPNGEASKSFSVYEQLLTKALECGLDRQSVIVALGGGVVGDIAGFVAATYMRGIRFIQVPTTLLAHDSSVGGKVAINHSLGKNMVGAFHQPEAVLYDTETLFTLPEHEWRSGFAEVMKHGLIREAPFYQWLIETIESFQELTIDKVNKMLEKSIAVKAEIVTEDEKEIGIRAFLNFGHTLGHAIETKLGYGRMTHGEAVVIGMVFAMKLSEEVLNVTLPIVEFKKWLKKFHYQTEIPKELSAQELLDTMKKDKKVEAGSIRMVLLKEVGEAVVQEVNDSTLIQALERALGE
ncbi:3-dehydroquinate synthase [Halalkalibacter urbisdiaboli]|uniref:3-dehydroquinate synthase n=1 Tax=Halalkalibacter urbisdiaboli TaxID=1960589 RepID=UPI000B44FFCD|nr:3-dehydroquinate synthase [Halalkalibacter urbisdiaboli]